MKKSIHTFQHAGLRDLLRRIRTDAGMTQALLAARLGWPQAVISNYERGERRLDLIELADVCEALNIPLAELVRQFEEVRAYAVTMEER